MAQTWAAMMVVTPRCMGEWSEPPFGLGVFGGGEVALRLEALEHIAGVQASAVQALRHEVRELGKATARAEDVRELRIEIAELRRALVNERGSGERSLDELIARLGGSASEGDELDPETMAAIFSADDER